MVTRKDSSRWAATAVTISLAIMVASLTLTTALSVGSQTRGPAVTQRYMSDSTEDVLEEQMQRAAALTEYMAKAHEEKLKAIKAVETKAQSEIRELRQELTLLKQQVPSSSALTLSSSPSSSLALGTDLESLSKEELIQKILQYQRFMADYVVKASQEKYNAVQATESLYKSKMSSLILAASAAAQSLSPPTSPAVPSSNRWASAEMQRVASGNQIGRMEVSGTRILSQQTQPLVTGVATMANGAMFGDSISAIPPEVVEADHGLRSNDNVGGPTLAERVLLGANAIPAQSSTVNIGAQLVAETAAAGSSLLYQQRTSKVIEAGMQGRWSSAELHRLNSRLGILQGPSSAASLTKTPHPMISSLVAAAERVELIVEEADHGMRADGGVAGPTLSERVLQGATLAPAFAVASSPAAVRDSSTSLFVERNHYLVASAAASIEMGRL
jgi:hypothetical protein